ncbi:MAG: hypothetical protein E2594_17105 [Pseudomonas sp.]|nr:hypothetical protein [Pseudomonas sp.]
MKLSEIFQALTYGELRQLNIGGAEASGITKENQNEILTHVNLGLTELHKRFLLREGRVTLQLLPGVRTYTVSKKHAQSNRGSWGVEKYILDSMAQPFEDDLLKIERVYDAKGQELGLNAGEGYGHPLNVRTISMNTLVLPELLKGDTVDVVYRANHPQLIREDNSFDPTEIEVDLPYSHLEALLFYVASRVMNPIGAGGGFHEGNNYAAKFEAACALLDNQGLRLDVGEGNTRLQRNGWV